MRKIKVYDQLSIYAQRMLGMMNDPGLQGLEADIYENEDSWILKYYKDEYREIYSIQELDRVLSALLVETVISELMIAKDPVEGNTEWISEVASYLVIPD